jgi:hypothetical protein
MNTIYMKGIKMNNIYTTKDFYVASYLKAKDFKMSGAERKGSIVYFSFENGREAQGAVDRLFKENETVGALDFITAFKAIKSVLFNV